VQHASDLIAQRVYALVQGYPTSTTTRLLRFDPMFGLAIQTESQHARCAPAGKSTLNRLEMAICPDLAQEQERYVKVTADSKVLEQVFRPVFVLYDSPPRQLFIDLDVTDDPVHAAGIGVFNRYYDSVCAPCTSSVVGIYYRPNALQMSTRQREPSTNSNVSFHKSGSTGPRCNLLCGVTAPIPVTTL